ncbi:MAG: hypothetical protein GX856_06910 [Gammaproteobacteria bacterium]|nr:hypothetical protein [Gammaproteobacteria bacterium]
MDPSGARVTLVTALAWRAIAEIVRRRHATHAFNVLQIHPGISARGLLQLQLHATSRGESLPAIDFSLGGPSGMWSAGSSPQGCFLDLLNPEPASVIDHIEEAVGLPRWRGALPATSVAALSVRVVAGLLESRVFDQHGWRSTLGTYGCHGGDVVADWAGLMGVNPSPPDPDGNLHRDARERLSRLVLIHRSADELPVAKLSGLQGRALIVDIATGRIARVEGGGVEPLGDLLQMRAAAGGSMARLLARLVTGL